MKPCFIYTFHFYPRTHAYYQNQKKKKKLKLKLKNTNIWILFNPKNKQIQKGTADSYDITKKKKQINKTIGVYPLNQTL